MSVEPSSYLPCSFLSIAGFPGTKNFPSTEVPPHFFSRKVNQTIFPHFLVVDFLSPKIGVGNFFRRKPDLPRPKQHAAAARHFHRLKRAEDVCVALIAFSKDPGFFDRTGWEQNQREGGGTTPPFWGKLQP